MPPNPPDKPISIPVNLTPKARAIVERLRADTGVPATTATERFFEWLADMPPKFRLAILNRDRQAQDELLADWFREHMSTRDLTIDTLSLPDVATRIQLIRKLLNEVSAMHEGIRDVAMSARKSTTGKKQD